MLGRSIFVGATEDAISYYDSSSPDGSHSSSTPTGAAIAGAGMGTGMEVGMGRIFFK
jgi:hypothetical protein